MAGVLLVHKGVSVIGASVGECSGNHFVPVFELPLLSSLFLGASERTVLLLPCLLFSPCRSTLSGKTRRKDFTTSILGHFSFLSWVLFVLLSVVHPEQSLPELFSTLPEKKSIPSHGCLDSQLWPVGSHSALRIPAFVVKWIFCSCLLCLLSRFRIERERLNP